MTDSLRFDVEAVYWSGDPLDKFAARFELEAASAESAIAEVRSILVALGKIEPAVTAKLVPERVRQIEYFGVPVDGLSSLRLVDLVDRT